MRDIHMEKTVITIDPDLEDLIPDYLNACRQETLNIFSKVEEQNFSYLRQLGHDWAGSGASYGFDFISVSGNALNQAAKSEDKSQIIQIATRLKQYLDNITIQYK